jgi:hypothetical protein
VKCKVLTAVNVIPSSLVAISIVEESAAPIFRTEEKMDAAGSSKMVVTLADYTFTSQ